MLRALFEKTGNAVYISHLDLMRLFQRAFQRAGLPLTHTQGYTPHPSVSIALPMSLGVESRCELLDFALDTDAFTCEEITARLNQALVEGVRVLGVYDGGDKIRNIAFLDCEICLEYDNGVPSSCEEKITTMLKQETVLVEKRGKNGITEQNISPMIRSVELSRMDENTVQIKARICCQNPSLNPVQITAAIERYLPELVPSFARYSRCEIYNANDEVFR